MAPRRFSNSLLPALALAALLGIAWLAYLPGLDGGFLFDDLVNLPALGATGKVDNWSTFWRYITSGRADPTGRPLALLSFLIDARSWPADPRPFLATNLLLHLINGTLLFALLRGLNRALRPCSAEQCRERSVSQDDVVALVASGAWLLHPLLVSTTLYIVQREAMLATLFVLLGLLAYSHGRRLHPRSPRAGLTWMALGLAGGTLLGTACKANGILLPLLAWVLESTVFRHSRDARLRTFRLVFLVAPSALLFAWLLMQAWSTDPTLALREWTLGERVMTQPRALVDYLGLLLVPRALSTGLFNDGYPASTGLLSPASTLPSLLIVAGLLVLGFLLRRRAPSAAAALLFFFAGHVLESSILPLELYYEHRNYLPALLAFWPLARGLWALRRPQWQRITIAFAALVLLAVTTFQRTTLWGDPESLAITWAARTPESPRAQAAASMAEMRAGRPDLAARRLAPLVRSKPQELQLALNLADARCTLGHLDDAAIAAVERALRTSRGGHDLAWRWIGRRIATASRQPCTGLTQETLADWVEAVAVNPDMQTPARRQDVASLRGRLALQRGDGAIARRWFDAALDAYPTPGAAAAQAAQLGQHGHFAQALAHLDHYDRVRHHRIRPQGLNMAVLHDRVLIRQRYWETEFARLRAALEDDLQRGARRP